MSVDDDIFHLFSDHDTETAAESAVYWLHGQLEPAPVEGLGQARVRLDWEESGETLFQVTVAWQEVELDG